VVLGLPWLVLLGALGVEGVLGTLTGLVLVLLIAVATITDVLWRKIYNWTTYPATVYSLVLSVTAWLVSDSLSLDWHVLERPSEGSVTLSRLLSFVTPLESLTGLVVGFGIMFLLFAIVQKGAGDVKLVMALGAIVGGPNRVVETLLYGYIAAGAFCSCYVIWRVGPLALLAHVAAKLRLRSGPVALDFGPYLRLGVPMAPFFSLGALLSLFWVV
jgi:Flp pilus assembly protein protease CpaA